MIKLLYKPKWLLKWYRIKRAFFKSRTKWSNIYSIKNNFKNKKSPHACENNLFLNDRVLHSKRMIYDRLDYDTQSCSSF